MKTRRTSDENPPKAGAKRPFLPTLAAVVSVLFATSLALFNGAGSSALDKLGVYDYIKKYVYDYLRKYNGKQPQTAVSSTETSLSDVSLAPKSNKDTAQPVSSICVSYSGDSPEGPRMANFLADELKRQNFDVVPGPGPHVRSVIVSVLNLDSPHEVENGTIGLFRATTKVFVETSINGSDASRSSFSVPGYATTGREDVQDRALQNAAQNIIAELAKYAPRKPDRWPR